MLRISIILAALSISGCAMTTAVPITDANRDIEGFRIYGAKPILIATGKNVQVTYIPNYSEVYAVRMQAFFAKNDTSIKINANGSLASIDSNLDSASALGTLLDFAEKALGKGSAGGPSVSAQIPGKGSGGFDVYDFVYDVRGNLVGMKPLLIKVGAKSAASAVASTPPPEKQGGLGFADDGMEDEG